jgi:hypothetical protein
MSSDGSFSSEQEGSFMLKKILVWGGIAFVVFFIAFRPGAAGQVVSDLGDVFVAVFGGIGKFFSGLAG